MKKINFSDQELQALLELLDAGVKSIGIQAAPAAAVLLQKVRNAEIVEETENDSSS